MNTSLRGWLQRVWRIIRWPVWVLLAVFVLLVVWRVPVVLEQQKKLKILQQDFNSLDQRVSDLEGQFEELNTAKNPYHSQ